MDTMKLDGVKKTTVVEQVMKQIKALIASSDYKPGDRIPTEQELAASFNVGRSTIREAIKTFNYLGVLKSVVGKGTFVQERAEISSEALTWSLLLGDDELNEMIDLRASLELWAMFRLAEELGNNSPEAFVTLSVLDSIISDMELGVRQKNRHLLKQADFNFHHTILHGCRNTLFDSLFETLRSFLESEIHQSQESYVELGKIPEEHRVMLDAIRSNDPGLIHKAYSGHITNIKIKLKD